MKVPHDPDEQLAELREYLGEGYEQRRLERAPQEVAEELERIGDEAELYRRSQAYLYDLTAFAMSGTKLPYLEALTGELPPPARLLDYGCGIGSDGLALIELGYEVEFAEFDNPSARYLRWRLERRGLQAPIHDLDSDVPAGFDAAYSFDVIEHVDDPFAFLAELERRARLVCVNFLEPMDDGNPLHHRALPIQELLDYTGSRSLRHHRLHHGRSHLVIYEP